MDRREFFTRVGATGLAITVLPIAGCATDSLPSITVDAGPIAFGLDGSRYRALPDKHALLIQNTTTRKIGKLGSGSGQLNYPLGVAILADLVYVVECGNHRVQCFDVNGASHGSFGSDELLYPSAIVAWDDQLVVADTWHGRLVAMAPNGDVTNAFGDKVLVGPRGLAVDGNGILVADSGARQVVRIGFDGRVQQRYEGDWVAPTAVATDGTNVFVADASTPNLAVFDRDGRRKATLDLEIAPTFLCFAADGTLYVG